jgi:antitoxin (DNA-binding transcriptional repressor) of toxin-antitoxin stability system
MSATVTIQEAQANLTELIRKLEPGEDLVIVDGDNPVATLSAPKRTSWPSQPGTAKHTSHWMSEDFDAPLEDFKEYME